MCYIYKLPIKSYFGKKKRKKSIYTNGTPFLKIVFGHKVHMKYRLNRVYVKKFNIFLNVHKHKYTTRGKTNITRDEVGSS